MCLNEACFEIWAFNFSSNRIISTEVKEEQEGKNDFLMFFLFFVIVFCKVSFKSCAFQNGFGSRLNSLYNI